MKKVTENIIINELAEKICNHGLAVPAIFALEMIKYVYLFWESVNGFFGPVVTVFVSGPQYYEIAELLEDRSNVELLLCLIEKNRIEKIFKNNGKNE